MIFSHSDNGCHNALSALRPTIMPIWPAFGVSVSASGMVFTSAAADRGGTIRSWAGRTPNAGQAISAGFIRCPATTHSPRAGLLSPYQLKRHSRATGAESGTPSFNQSSSATKDIAAALAGFSSANARNLFQPCIGSSEKNIVCSASTGRQPAAEIACSSVRRPKVTAGGGPSVPA